jgi:bromodomain-containing factor 1
MGTLEKETISNGLMSLPDDVSGTVLDMIKADQPDVDVSSPSGAICPILI